jgi:1-acyl-sn-glycerol-3-phosphate acyltransferase
VAKTPSGGRIETGGTYGSSRDTTGAMYGVACWVVLLSLGAVVWPVLLVLPRLEWRWKVARTMGQLLCLFLAVPLKTRGSLPSGEPCVYVANHTSFIDSFALFVLFEEPVVFVAGRVLSRQPVVGSFLRRVGAVFVGSEPAKGVSFLESVLASLQEVVRSGRCVVIFPEGGLSLTPELRRFHLGAFVVAAETDCPVVPIGIRGTRAMLPAGRRLPRRGAIELCIGQPIRSNGVGRKAARQLAERAHAAVTELLEET